jgi:hypothetical protein
MGSSHYARAVKIRNSLFFRHLALWVTDGIRLEAMLRHRGYLPPLSETTREDLQTAVKLALADLLASQEPQV